MIRAVVLALPFLACLNAPPADYISTHGVEYRFEPGARHWASVQIETQEAYLINGLESIGYLNLNEYLNNVPVYVYGGVVPCMNTKGCNGTEDNGTLQVKNMGCPYNSALAHEMAHLIRLKAKGDADYGHTDTTLWNIANKPAGKCIP